MAEAVLAAILADRGVEVRSAGLGALVGEVPDPLAQSLMTERGLDISTHRARQVTAEDLNWSDLALVMEAWQQKDLERRYPSAVGRVHRLGKWEDIDILDPYRQPRYVFEMALADIDTSIKGWKARFWQ